jgi:hypothetical protein
MTTLIVALRMEWIGHILRIDYERVAEKLFRSKPDGRRRMGRPKL